MIKKLLILISIVCLLTRTIAVFADVVHGNDFYYRNSDKMERIGERSYGRRFIINSPNGYVIPKEEPNSQKAVPSGMGYRSGWGGSDIDDPEDIIFIFKNGEIFTIEAVYLCDGEYWGVMVPSHRYQPTGWVLMDELLMIYDRPYFEAENMQNFYEYTGSYEAVLSAKKLVQWHWPGSDREKRIVESDISEYADVLYAYKDKDGREWGKTKYSEWWICLSDPENSDILSFYPAPKPTKWAADGNLNWSADNEVTVWPPVDYKELRTANRPQAAFDNISENEFFNRNISVIEKLKRNKFSVNGPDGNVVLRAEPGMDGEIITHWALGQMSYKNEEELSINHVYCIDGEYWGFSAYKYGGVNLPGWISMDHLSVMYTNNDFIDEHADELYTYAGDICTAVTTEAFVLWEWPGSDRESKSWGRRVLDERESITRNAYIDEEGMEWVYIETYWNSDVTGWICINDPMNKEIPAFNPSPKLVKWMPDFNYELPNIEKIRKYESDKTFIDIFETDWFNNAVTTAFEYGILNGKDSNTFDPHGQLTGAEAVTIAARIHAHYKYGKAEGTKKLNEYNEANQSWWDGNVSYCEAEGLIDVGAFDNYLTVPITRAQMVCAWSKILEPKDMKKQNIVLSLPDVNENMSYFEDIILFYEAGIIGGVDIQGSFNPNNSITRSETAIIFIKLIDVSKREFFRTYGE